MILKAKGEISQINETMNNLCCMGAEANHILLDNENIIIVSNPEKLNMLEVSKEKTIKEISHIKQPYKLANIKFKPEGTKIKVKGVTIGGKKPVIISGPCAIESEIQLFETARKVKAAGANILRGGAFKPRTSPYSFQGLGKEGLILLNDIGRRLDMPVITEVLSEADYEIAEALTDIVQIGARNMQNYTLLARAGRSNKPVMIKRGPSSTVKELLLAAEYVLSKGNSKVILCERGIRTFEDMTRYTLDISIVPLIRELSHLPILVDPSHSSGKRELIESLSMSAIAAGAHGLMIESHFNPDAALCDGPQSILPEDLGKIIKKIDKLWRAIS